VLTSPRIWTEDVTPEKLGAMMADHDECMAIINDEAGILATLAGRYNRGVANLDLFLKAHNGSAVRVDRGSRPPVMMQRPALTMALSPQPSVLQGLALTKPEFRDAASSGAFCICCLKARWAIARDGLLPCPRRSLPHTMPPYARCSISSVPSQALSRFGSPMRRARNGASFATKLRCRFSGVHW
jgi:Protein of unknown function (DUF3987)